MFIKILVRGFLIVFSLFLSMEAMGWGDGRGIMGTLVGGGLGFVLLAVAIIQGGGLFKLIIEREIEREQ